MKTAGLDAFFAASVEKVALFTTLPYKPPSEPPGEACRGGSYAFEKQAETAKSIPSQEAGLRLLCTVFVYTV
ncbi:MAG: hypothetical protein JSR78_01940 [Proteobacteria bacterium]|nr:hypothetical protein [Pseudomonadota bacterium]